MKDRKHQQAQLMAAMITYYQGDPKRVHHFLKVHDFAAAIGVLEALDPQTQWILETAAIVHDIGIKISEEKYGNCNGKHQEEEGPPLARKMLEELGFEASVIDRVCYLVGHHHSYSHIDGIDHQILVEGDFLVNLYEDEAPRHAVEKAYRTIFHTETGRQFCRESFGLKS
ncbi:MAG TPA: HD domain-containing protein [Firmicutes bacterium]|nr:HD domain-containing protein [Bacillota bacterium]